MAREKSDDMGRGAGRMRRRDWLWFLILVLGVFGMAGTLGWESTRDADAVTYRDMRAVAHWFDPVFFQYNLIMAVAAVLIVPVVTLTYVLTMTGRKERRLYYEIPEARRGEIPDRLRSRMSFGAYAGSVGLTTLVVLLGASIILLFKPVPGPELRGLDFSLGANVLMMGPFIELFASDPDAYYLHLTRSLTAFEFGFLGAYIYFIGALVRAYFTLDLTPHTFIDGTVRMIGASVLALVLSFLPWVHEDVQPAVALVATPVATAAQTQAPDAAATKAGQAGTADESGVSSGRAESRTQGPQHKSTPNVSWSLSLLPIISFFFGIFPKTALLAIQRAALTAVPQVVLDQYRALPLSGLAGMSYAHELRLEREGFDNIENFCSADPVSLAVRTGFSYPQLVQWISEAWLATRLREDYAEFVRHTGLSSRDELHLFLSGWDAALGNAAEFLTSGVPDPALRQSLKVKLGALATLLAAAAKESQAGEG